MIIFHGSWSPYEPRRLPPSAPLGTIFAKRDKDGKDWYKFVEEYDAKEGHVFFTCIPQLGVLTVGSAVRDITKLFPAKQLVFEIEDFEGDPKRLNGMVYNSDTEEFTKLALDKLVGNA